ncbi:MAG TPA: hypothetical protein PKE01_15165, partial [Rhodocyclaceae bacterium]|nr:hypothetical protein [Rhodocyclaceae bacterium]
MLFFCVFDVFDGQHTGVSGTVEGHRHKEADAQERGQVGTGLPAGTPARHVGPTPVHSLAKSRT